MTNNDYEMSIERLVKNPELNHKLYQWKEILKRVYLDTCTLLDGLVGHSRISSDVPNLTERDRNTVLARRITEEWLPSHIVVSPYVIGEFIEVAVNGFSIPEADAQKVLVDFLRRGVTIEYADLDLRLAKIYDEVGHDPQLLLSYVLKGPATGPDGLHLSRAEGGFRLYRSGMTTHYANMGLTPDTRSPDPKDLQFDEGATATVSAPAYELAFFHTVARLVEGTGVNWKDAFHYLYAKWAQAQAILTTNTKDFRKGGRQVKGYPPVYTPLELEAEMKSRHPELHTLVFGDG